MKDEDYEKLSNESKAKYKQDLEKNKLLKKNPRDPYERENAIFVDYCRQRLSKMKPERILLLDSIHTGILAPIKTDHNSQQRKESSNIYGASMLLSLRHLWEMLQGS